jgi:lipoprotein-anchoring transpeptidase ErfK/SrfK
MSKLNKYLFLFGFVFVASPVFAASIDTDRDGLSDEDEAYYHTDPNNPDTDGDGFWDGVEVDFDYSPHRGGAYMHENDYDDDGLNDWLERWFGSDMGVADTSGDGFTDFDRVMNGYSPISTATSTQFDRHITVDLTRQMLYYFVDNIKIKTFPVSTGNPSTPTPPGEYAIQRMIDVKRYVGADYDLPNVWWNMEFLPMYYIHGTYWHNNFGIRTQSHGCVNMKTEDAGLLYKYMDINVPVTVTGTTPGRFYVGT